MAVRSERGQTATEYMLVISVVVVAVVAAAYAFVPNFRAGVWSLAADVETILGGGQIGGVGVTRADDPNIAGGYTVAIASRRCDEGPADPRHAAMFAPPPCEGSPAAVAASPMPTPFSCASVHLPAGGRASFNRDRTAAESRKIAGSNTGKNRSASGTSATDAAK